MKRLKPAAKPSIQYAPHVGYVGRSPMRVPNYLFSSLLPGEGYSHCRTVVSTLQARSVADEYVRSQRLTEFIQKRGLSFSRWNGHAYEEFSVPCAPLALPIPNSLFKRLQSAAQLLVAALRYVLQDIYGEKIPERSAFVKSLPVRDRKLFLDAIYTSPHYFPALHHSSMREYPFFDVVGLDLVLTRDLDALEGSSDTLPFRLLEINAGAPSGAANNLHILDGLQRIDPELISTLGEILPNDHFATLRETYDSLGRTWTGCPDGISVLVPPGGENGATPEIQELSARSGLLYCNASQLYADAEGNIRVRTVDGANPRVTSIYSRVNADSLLYSPERNVFLRDPETGEPLELSDPLSEDEEEGEKYLPPVESLYQIPGILDAIQGRRIYLGGLNRVLDNKIILEILCSHAPEFYEKKLRRAGQDVRGTPRLLPPKSLRSTHQTLKHLMENPQRWVVKAPNLSGGRGIHILRCMSPRARAKVLSSVRHDPRRFAFQELVPIGRIPVPVRQNRKFRYANVAADLRMWVFFGDGPQHEKPRLTRNALVRTAPNEKGPLSSIVNTSMGGGYAGMVVVDDSAKTERASGITTSVTEAPPRPDVLPLGVGAQLRQTARIARALLRLAQEGGSPADAAFLASALRSQVREVTSFLNPACVEELHDIVQFVRASCDASGTSVFGRRLAEARLLVVDELARIKHASDFSAIFGIIDKLAVWNFSRTYTESDAHADQDLLARRSSAAMRERPRLGKALQRLVDARAHEISASTSERLLALLPCFLERCREALSSRSSTRSLLPFFDLSYNDEPKVWGGVFPLENRHTHQVATWWEWGQRKRLVEGGFVEEGLLEARQAWMRVMEEAARMPATRRALFIHTMRERHFARFPRVAELQDVLDGQTRLSWNESLLELLRVLPYARFNLEAMAARNGVSLAELFVETPTSGRIAVLPRSAREARGWSLGCSGECSLFRPNPRALYTESEILTWVAAEAAPFVAAYTAGHESVHAVQLEEMVALEAGARRGGELAWIDFAHKAAAVWEESFADEQTTRMDIFLGRTCLQGFEYARTFGEDVPWVQALVESARKGACPWNTHVSNLGMISALGTEPSLAARVRALREVVPALENAKNIRFAKELGLRWPASAVRAALPWANALQREWLTPVVEKLMTTLEPDADDLRLLACGQLPGVYFPRGIPANDVLWVEAGLGALGYGGVGCQSQQQ